MYRAAERPMMSPIVVKLRNINFDTRRPLRSSLQIGMKTILDWGLPKLLLNSCELLSPLAPWQSLEEHISDYFAPNPKNLSVPQTNQIYNELIDNKYKKRSKIFTDGSKAEGGAAAAAYVLIPDTKVIHTYKCRLPDNMSVLGTELFAIQEALKHIKDNSTVEQNFVICTDSLSAVLLLRQKDPSSYRSTAYSIQEDLLTLQQKITIQWIRGHQGIAGNELADQAAKAAISERHVHLVGLSYDENIAQLNRKLMTVWQNHWDERTMETSSGLFLRSTKNTLQSWPWTSHQNRAVETGLARLRSGHVGVAQHLHRFGMSETPLCTCGEIETVGHFLLGCSLLAQQ
jgi:ribonuclease HI